MTVMIIQGKVENIFDNDDFARILQEKLGSDAEQYFREQTNPKVFLEDADEDLFMEVCGGDCKLVDEYAGLLDEVEDALDDIEADCEDEEIQKSIRKLRDKIREGMK